MKWRYYWAVLYTEKKRSHWLKQWPISKGLGDKKGELSLAEDVIWTSLERWTGQPMESSKIDGVAMGSPLGPAFANIFVGHQEQKLFNVVSRPLAYFWYVEDTFAVFSNEEDCNAFLSHLNSLHPSSCFTKGITLQQTRP